MFSLRAINILSEVHFEKESLDSEKKGQTTLLQTSVTKYREEECSIIKGKQYTSLD